MSETKPKLAKRRWRPFSSLSAKIMLILLSMGAVSASLGFLATVVFTKVAEDMEDLTVSRLKSFEASSRLIVAASETKDAMIGVLTSQDQTGLDARADTVEAAQDALHEAVANLPETVAKDVQEDAENAIQMLDRLMSARNIQFRNEAGIENLLAELQSAGAMLQTEMVSLANDAFAELQVSGEATLAAVDETLMGLVDEHFATLQAILEARAEINLLSGTLFSLQLTEDRATQTILLDVSTAAMARLEGAAETLAAIESAADHAESLAAAGDTFAAFIDANTSRSASARAARGREILAARRDLDILLSNATDDVVFMLSIAAEDASSSNHTAIESLLNTEVATINQLFTISNWLGSFKQAALNLVIAPNREDAQAAAQNLQRAAKGLLDFSGTADGRLSKDLKSLAKLADLETGLLAYKLSVLDANATATEATLATSSAVIKIGRDASELGASIQADIASMAASIQAEIAEANQWITNILVLLGAVVLGSFVLTRLLVQRPLHSLRGTTERLAEGDLREVTGFERSSEEIYRIANALAVFRGGLLENREMTARQDAERQARMAEQNAVVEAIGNGLSRLSKGDLTKAINEDMSDGYAKLRDDFNAAQANLREILGAMSTASSGIRSGATEINAASDDLSRRTENQAAALEQSVAALDQVTSSVRASVEAFLDVESRLLSAKTEAEQTGAAVQSAIGAMHEIKNSSDKISRIVGVIDDIAFQTNLLAINAGVEAARAGEAGSGFAVVAAEVRGLAQRSSISASEIKLLIDESTSHVTKGVDHVNHAGKALVSMQERIEGVSSSMGLIAGSANDQSASLKEVNSAMISLDQVTQDNAAMVQSTVSSTSRLNEDASRLVGLSTKFRFDPASKPAPDRNPGFEQDMATEGSDRAA